MLARRPLATCIRSLPKHHRPLRLASIPVIASSFAPRYSRAFSASRQAMAAIQRSAFFEAIRKHDPSSTAVVNYDSGVAFSYGSLLRDVSRAKEKLLKETGKDESSIAGERIAFMVENGYDYVGADRLWKTSSNASWCRLQKLSLALSHSPRCPSLQCHRRTVGTFFSRG